MSTMTQKIEAVKRKFDRNAQRLTALNLVKYPEGTLGQHLGKFLLTRNYGQNTYASREDILQMLITGNKPTLTDEIALQYYLFGNGSTSLRVLLAMCMGLAIMPYKLLHFYKMYQKGKNALRFFDIDHLGMLYQPVQRIKETFMIQEP